MPRGDVALAIARSERMIQHRNGFGKAAVGRRGRTRTDPDINAVARKSLRTLHGNARWEIAGRRLPLTNLDKVLWPADGLTKRDMIEYYVRMAPYMLPYLRDRPLSMQVFPDGIDGKSFWRRTNRRTHRSGSSRGRTTARRPRTYIVVNEVATLAWVANAGVIDLHPVALALRRAEGAGLGGLRPRPVRARHVPDVIDIAKLVKAALDHYGMHGVVKTSGQTGLQIYVPVRRGPDYAAVRNWVEEVGKAIDQAAPGRVSWEWSVAKTHRPDSHRLHAEHHQQDARRPRTRCVRRRARRCRRPSRGRSWTIRSCARIGWTIATIAQPRRRESAISSHRCCTPTRTCPADEHSQRRRAQKPPAAGTLQRYATAAASDRAAATGAVSRRLRLGSTPTRQRDRGGDHAGNPDARADRGGDADADADGDAGDPVQARPVRDRRSTTSRAPPAPSSPPSRSGTRRRATAPRTATPKLQMLGQNGGGARDVMDQRQLEGVAVGRSTSRRDRIRSARRVPPGTASSSFRGATPRAQPRRPPRRSSGRSRCRRRASRPTSPRRRTAMSAAASSRSARSSPRPTADRRDSRRQRRIPNRIRPWRCCCSMPRCSRST